MSCSINGKMTLRVYNRVWRDEDINSSKKFAEYSNAFVMRHEAWNVTILLEARSGEVYPLKAVVKFIEGFIDEYLYLIAMMLLKVVIAKKLVFEDRSAKSAPRTKYGYCLHGLSQF